MKTANESKEKIQLENEIEKLRNQRAAFVKAILEQRKALAMGALEKAGITDSPPTVELVEADYRTIHTTFNSKILDLREKLRKVNGRVIELVEIPKLAEELNKARDERDTIADTMKAIEGRINSLSTRILSRENEVIEARENKYRVKLPYEINKIDSSETISSPFGGKVINVAERAKESVLNF